MKNIQSRTERVVLLVFAVLFRRVSNLPFREKVITLTIGAICIMVLMSFAVMAM